MNISKRALNWRTSVTIECNMMINIFLELFFDTRKLLSVSKMFQQPWQEFYKPLNILELQDYLLLYSKAKIKNLIFGLILQKMAIVTLDFQDVWKILLWPSECESFSSFVVDPISHGVL